MSIYEFYISMTDLPKQIQSQSLASDYGDHLKVWIQNLSLGWWMGSVYLPGTILYVCNPGTIDHVKCSWGKT